MITTKFSTKTLVFHLWASCSFPFGNSHCCFPNTFPQIANPPGILISQYPQNALAPSFITVAHKSDPTGTLNSHHNLRDRDSPQKLNFFTLLWYIVFLPSMGYLVCPAHVLYPLGRPFMSLQLTSKHPALANTWYPQGFSHSHNHQHGTPHIFVGLSM